MQKSPDPERSGNIAKTIGYYIAFVALGLTVASFGPTLPGLAERTHASLGQISYLFTARSLGYLFGSLRGGRWYDRFRGHRVQAAMLLLMAAMMALVPTLPILWLLAAALVVLGFAEGTVDVGGNILLVWVHREKVGPYMNGLHLFFGVGAFLSPVIIAQALAVNDNISIAYWALAILLLPAALLLARQPSPPIRVESANGQGRGADMGLVVLIMLFFFLNVGVEGSFGGWIFTYASALGLGSEVTAAYLTAAFWGALTVGRLLSIPIAARVHPRWILLVDVLGCLASVGVILIWQKSFPAAWLGTLGMGFFMASVFPTTITLAGRYLPLNGTITGWFLVGGSAGMMFFPWLIGQLFEPVGPPVAMLIMLFALALALVVYASLLLRIHQTGLDLREENPQAGSTADRTRSGELRNE